MLNATDVAGTQALARHAASVEIGAVGAAQVVDEVLILLARDAGVEARNGRVIEDDPIFRVATDRDRQPGRLEHHGVALGISGYDAYVEHGVRTLCKNQDQRGVPRPVGTECQKYHI